MEEACLLAAAVWLYAHLHFSWLLFAVLFLAPDLFMLGFLANPRVGAAIYNLGHWLLLPLALFAAGYWAGRREMWLLGSSGSATLHLTARWATG